MYVLFVGYDTPPTPSLRGETVTISRYNHTHYIRSVLSKTESAHSETETVLDANKDKQALPDWLRPSV